MKKLSFYSIMAIWMVASMLSSCTDVYEPYEPDPIVPEMTPEIGLNFTPRFWGTLPDIVDIESVIVTVNGTQKVFAYEGKDIDTTYTLNVDQFPADITYRVAYKINPDAKVIDDKLYSCVSKVYCSFMKDSTSQASYTSHQFERNYIKGDEISGWVNSINNIKSPGHFVIDENGKICEDPNPTPMPDLIYINDIQNVKVRALTQLGGSVFGVIEADMVCQYYENGKKQTMVLPCVNESTEWIKEFDAFQFPNIMAYKLQYRVKPNAIIVDDTEFSLDVTCTYLVTTTTLTRQKKTGMNQVKYEDRTMKGSFVKKWIEMENAKNEYFLLDFNERGIGIYRRTALD
ncbi:MAG: hypothetical protein KBT09_04725 [Bacteroidales bacterium]|nr:hypothetical protein [Candidatus Sodaliphilus fimicaballi]